MKKILFIEDEAALQQAIGQMLTDAGYRVLTAMDGEAGIAAAEKEIPELILLDLILPKKDGFEVLTALKKNPRTRAIPIIVLTNLEQTEDVEKTLQLGATTYLVKTSYRLNEVLEKIKNALGD